MTIGWKDPYGIFTSIRIVKNNSFELGQAFFTQFEDSWLGLSIDKTLPSVSYEILLSTDPLIFEWTATGHTDMLDPLFFGSRVMLILSMFWVKMIQDDRFKVTGLGKVY